MKNTDRKTNKLMSSKGNKLYRVVSRVLKNKRDILNLASKHKTPFYVFDHKEYLEKSEKDLLLQLTSDAQNAFTENNKILKRKVKLYRFAIALLIISSFLLILSKVGKFYV